MSQAAQFNSNSAAQQPRITAHVNVGGQWRPFSAILDSGNDITLIGPDTAAKLGISRRMARSNFKVQFGQTANQAHNFYMVNIPMRFENLRPFMASIGVGPVRENLIGRKDAFEHHTIVFNRGQIKMFQSGPNQNTFGVDLSNNRSIYESTQKSGGYRGLIPNNYI